MQNPFILSFKNNISVIEESSDRIIIQSPRIKGNIPQYTLTIEPISPGLLAAIKTLAAEGATEENLSDLVLQSDGVSELPQFYYYLEQFIKWGMLCHTVLCEGLPLATRIPIYPLQKFQLQEAAIERSYAISRFAYCHKIDEQLVLESPLSQVAIILKGWKGAALVAELAKPQTCKELCTKIPGISQETVRQFFSLLLSSEMLGEVSEEGKLKEEEREALVSWEFHDLLFHARSRRGRHSNPAGKTFRFVDKIPQPPMVKPKVSDNIIELYQPDIEKLKQDDYPFTRVLEERQSVRRYSDKPMTDKQLGEFIYRCARNKRIVAKDYGECTHRPYANSGGRYELELYAIVNTCENLDSGIYRYCPEAHQLTHLSSRNSQVEVLLEDAYLANGKSCMPQVLLIFAARFPRIAWVYESIAYSLILKDVGSLQQTMYLVATAMNLAPCAIGAGNSDLFAAAVGTDYYAETSVGEFILGSQPIN
ncbi:MULTISPECIES: SagB family peptide dehydrogenase [unclassified Coleofasciculus]|uniref:SagB family peptide dehydrogenase n=1 Tax=unclassified Coleofasciculus TaxID=2692782 RepID=UPI00188163E9|nr:MULTISPECIES: SagB family peptide dehydrogenase [unclassified Coleofasciculus]MBE9128875.1 SagB family peptide dehydrogenase [Coleofasciculus sp. LEGE 07081]MBE9151596.1 SagB family peptide dehydrogenase [Coleofasciculus sp. LEGE 07092]